MEPAPIVVPDPVGGRVGDGVSIKKWEKEYEIILRCRFRGRIHNSSTPHCRVIAFAAVRVAPISCPQSLFVIVAVPPGGHWTAQHLSPLYAPFRSDALCFFCFFPVSPSVAFGRHVVSDVSHPSLALSPKSCSFICVCCSLTRSP